MIKIMRKINEFLHYTIIPHSEEWKADQQQMLRQSAPIPTRRIWFERRLDINRFDPVNDCVLICCRKWCKQRNTGKPILGGKTLSKLVFWGGNYWDYSNNALINLCINKEHTRVVQQLMYEKLPNDK
jgi:hypothetical protein